MTAQQPLPLPELLSTEQVARRLNVTARRVQQLDDELRPMFVGRVRVYLAACVERYAAARDHAKSERAR